jgi:polysaccharide biosynthesis transport protein
MLEKPANSPGAAPVPELGPRLLAPDQPRESAREGLSGFISAIRQRRMTLIAVIVLVPLCTWFTLQQVTPLYTATGSLIYEPSAYKLRELESIVRQDPTTEGMMASQAEILQSLHIAQRVAERGNLFDNPEFNAALRPANFCHRLLSGLRELLGMESEEPPDDPVYGPVQDPQRDRTLLAVKDRLHAAPVRFSHVIEVTFVGADPLQAAAAVNNAMDVYIKDQYAAKHRLVETATELLEKEARDLRRQVNQGEERISTYRGEHAMSQGMHAATGNEEITHLAEDLVKAQSERAAANARLVARSAECVPGPPATARGRRPGHGSWHLAGSVPCRRSVRHLSPAPAALPASLPAPRRRADRRRSKPRHERSRLSTHAPRRRTGG